MTQGERILDYLREHDSITTVEAILHIGVGDLGKRVSELRRAGWNIVGEFEDGTNRYGERTRYMRYRLKGRTL